MKAVLFDVYQTLLLGKRHPDRESRWRRVLGDFGVDYPTGRSLSHDLDRAIAREHQRAPHPFPEVDIREIWQELIPELKDPDAFALAAEQAVHPVIAMPGAIETLSRLHRKRTRIGVISNAQAYTQVLLDRHLGEAAHSIDPELSFFSYAHRRAKPDPHLFSLAAEALGRRGIPPHEVLMVGDSPTNDIKPAKAQGFQTLQVTQHELALPHDAENPEAGF